MKPVDLLFLARAGRQEFTLESFAALLSNTEPLLIRRIFIYTDGPAPMIGLDDTGFWSKFLKVESLQWTLIEDRLYGPVAIMNHYLENYSPRGVDFVKIDDDLVLPPNWLGRLLAIADLNPDVALLGVEPWAPELPDLLTAAPRGVVEFRHIGGIGLMRRSAFACPDCDQYPGMKCPNCKGSKLDLPKPARDGRFGFTEWQWNREDLKKAFLAPALECFLLDHLPLERYERLSKAYVEKLIQRQPWAQYPPELAGRLWSWWAPKF